MEADGRRNADRGRTGAAVSGSAPRTEADGRRNADRGRTGLLSSWVRFQLAIDLVAGVVLMFAPLALLAQIPIPVVPHGALAVRLLGLYPAGLALAWGVAAPHPARAQPALWIGNAFRVLGGTALLLGAAIDAGAPALLRGVWLGEWTFVVVTAVLMARAGIEWRFPVTGAPAATAAPAPAGGRAVEESVRPSP